MSTASWDWEPGDPLYSHPTQRDYGDGNYIRRLFDLLDDEGSAARNLVNVAGNFGEAVCPHCLVGWPATEGPDCWVCGKPAPNYELALDSNTYLRQTQRHVAILRGGPGFMQRFLSCYNTPVDEDHIWVRVTAIGEIYQVTDPASAAGCVLHRYVRTDEWSHRYRGYVFEYEGEES